MNLPPNDAGRYGIIVQTQPQSAIFAELYVSGKNVLICPHINAVVQLQGLRDAQRPGRRIVIAYISNHSHLCL